jgi:hypothetical protein
MRGRLEPLVIFATQRSLIAPTSEFRATWLTSSMRSLKARNLLERYYAELPPGLVDTIRFAVPATWLPASVAESHYAACDALNLGRDEAFAIGCETAEHMNATLLSLASRLAKTSGITPWHLLSQHQRIWSRIWRGGDVAVWKAGPKDAVVDIEGWSCARYSYIRHAFRGVLTSLMGLVTTRVHVAEISTMASPKSLGYHVAWA